MRFVDWLFAGGFRWLLCVYLFLLFVVVVQDFATNPTMNEPFATWRAALIGRR